MPEEIQTSTEPVQAPTPLPKRSRLAGWIAPTLLLLLVALFYSTALSSPSVSIHGDTADVHYPAQKYLAERWRTELPFWTPYIYAGYPLLSNPKVGAWYPLNWPFLSGAITPHSLQVEIALHAFFAALGAYLLFLLLVGRRDAALIGALAYGLSGFFAGHSTHLGLLSAAACFPWLLLAYRYAVDAASVRYTALAAIAGGCMILTGSVQGALFGFLALALYALSDIWASRDQAPRVVAILATIVIGALGVSAIQTLPALELLRNSVRASANFSASHQGSLTPSSLLTLVWPDALGSLSGKYGGPFEASQYYFYGGLLLLPLAALGAARSRLRIPALLLIVPSFWYMLGPSAGLYRAGVIVPLLSKFANPVRAWFVVAFALAMLAAAGSAWLIEQRRTPWLGALLAILLFADLAWWNSFHNPLAYDRTSFAARYGDNERLGAQLVAKPQLELTRFEAAKPVGGLGPLLHPLDIRFETTYGFFALEPAALRQYFEIAAANPKLKDGLNATRFFNLAEKRLDVNPRAVSRVYFPRIVEIVSTLEQSRNALFNLDPASLKSVVLSPNEAVWQDPAAEAIVLGHDEQSYRINYQAASPSLLKLTESWYPGWYATIGRRQLPVLRVDHAFMGVIVPPGKNRIEFHFRSNRFGTGLWTTVGATCILGLLMAFGRSRHPRQQEAGRRRRRRKRSV